MARRKMNRAQALAAGVEFLRQRAQGRPDPNILALMQRETDRALVEIGERVFQNGEGLDEDELGELLRRASAVTSALRLDSRAPLVQLLGRGGHLRDHGIEPAPTFVAELRRAIEQAEERDRLRRGPTGNIHEDYY
jgi:hypothetical protein